jgi:hypothetical protein
MFDLTGSAFMHLRNFRIGFNEARTPSTAIFLAQVNERRFQPHHL